jgi:hypothetical protein
MPVYVFGNPDVPEDNIAFGVAKKLQKIPNVEFVFIEPNADLPFAGEKHVVILDTVQGIEKVTLIDQTHLDKLIINRGVTAHGYDLGFQLKYLIKLGKLSMVSIIGLPQSGALNYDLIQSILRKLVEQDMQGS